MNGKIDKLKKSKKRGWKIDKILKKEERGMWRFELPPSHKKCNLNTTRNYLTCDELSATFSENITKSTVFATYSFFCHGCALMDIEAQNTVMIC
jgi:Pyruvate/2-oxoacid:ferredoxin oxidoreductase delta subunit